MLLNTVYPKQIKARLVLRIFWYFKSDDRQPSLTNTKCLLTPLYLSLVPIAGLARLPLPWPLWPPSRKRAYGCRGSRWDPIILTPVTTQWPRVYPQETWIRG